MNSCPACFVDNSDGSNFCSACGAALRPEYLPTVTASGDAASAEESVPSSSSETSQHGRFLPGAIVAGRYRIVSQIGKGGMGEVYRADDLKLGHSVALKFLPKSLAKDPQRLEYFHNEVRLTRQISHPNVCRVYDIGEVEGEQFLSMEYVDGEDLQVLLRRIGRLPGDKGVEIAQQICAGLAAAHENGVLHRDLKPANVMLDGRGRVRITDFGLAQLAERVKPGEVAGTPAYMAPEQLALGQATIQSDLYALGLILFEVFTGKRARGDRSLNELKQAHDESITHPSALVSDIDSAVERVILHCLEKEPHERPKSAQAVAGALPSGDPLAAALAAGETPSPQMVAAARQNLGLTARGVVGVLVALLVLLPANCRMADQTDPVNRAGLDDEPAVLAAEARRLITDQFGYDEPPVDEIYGLKIEKKGAVGFWLRQNVDIPFMTDSYWIYWGRPSRVRPNWWLPRWNVPGERGLIMDPHRRLQLFRAIPSVTTSPSNAETAPNWTAWFTPETTGFRLAIGDNDVAASDADAPVPVLRLVENRFVTPRDPFDAVAVWTGLDPQTDETVYVEAAAFRGRPTYFEKFSQREFENPSSVSAMLYGTDNARWLGRTIITGLYLCLLMTGVVLAWHNLGNGRGDRRGAVRLAGCVFCLETAALVTLTRHIADPTHELAFVFIVGISQVLFATGRAWVWYIALEPYARRIWPRVLISWSRLLDGRWRNSLVGRDLLLGVATGVCGNIFSRLNSLVQTRLTDSTPSAIPTNTLTLDGTKELLGVALECHSEAIMSAMFVLLILVLLRIALKTERRAIVGSVLICTSFLTLLAGGNLSITASFVVLQMAITLAVLVRLGFLALVVQMSTHRLLEAFPLTTDAGHWYFNHGLFAIVWVSGIALYGVYTLLRGQSAFAVPASSPLQ